MQVHNDITMGGGGDTCQHHGVGVASGEGGDGGGAVPPGNDADEGGAVGGSVVPELAVGIAADGARPPQLGPNTLPPSSPHRQDLTHTRVGWQCAMRHLKYE